MANRFFSKDLQGNTAHITEGRGVIVSFNVKDKDRYGKPLKGDNGFVSINIKDSYLNDPLTANQNTDCVLLAELEEAFKTSYEFSYRISHTLKKGSVGKVTMEEIFSDANKGSRASLVNQHTRVQLEAVNGKPIVTDVKVNKETGEREVVRVRLNTQPSCDLRDKDYISEDKKQQLDRLTRQIDVLQAKYLSVITEGDK